VTRTARGKKSWASGDGECRGPKGNAGLVELCHGAFGEVAPFGDGPLVVDLDEDGADESGDGVFVGEDPVKTPGNDPGCMVRRWRRRGPGRAPDSWRDSDLSRSCPDRGHRFPVDRSAPVCTSGGGIQPVAGREAARFFVGTSDEDDVLHHPTIRSLAVEVVFLAPGPTWDVGAAWTVSVTWPASGRHRPPPRPWPHPRHRSSL
jgi:hypothetical protein